MDYFVAYSLFIISALGLGFALNALVKFGDRHFAISAAGFGVVLFISLCMLSVLLR